MLSSSRSVNGASFGRFTNFDGHSALLQRRKRISNEFNNVQTEKINIYLFTRSNYTQQSNPSSSHLNGFTNVIGHNKPIQYSWSSNGWYWWIRDNSWLFWIRFSSILGISTMEGWEATVSVFSYAIFALLLFIALLNLPSYLIFTLSRLSYYLTGVEDG